MLKEFIDMKDRNTLRRTRSGNFVKVHGDIVEILDEVAAEFELFKRKNCHRIPDTPSDHRYVSYKLGGLKEVLSGSNSRRKIKLEWENLSDNVSGTPIFVRAYEGRIDLMRAAIIGPPGSPYEHAIFFFDIFLPWNYPATPAKVFYRPCQPDNFEIMFLKFQTWYDRVLEKNGEPVSILDILLAIHKLLSRPNTNSNKNDMEVSNSPTPTQGAVALELQRHDMMDFGFTCRKIIYDMREPPKDFKDFVAGYYRQKSHSILLKLKENMDVSDRGMVLVFKGLYETFRKNGSYVGHYLGFLETLEEQEKSGEDLERASAMNGWNIGAGWEARALMDSFRKLL